MFIIALKTGHIGSHLLIGILEDVLLNVLMDFLGLTQLKDVKLDALRMNTRILLFVYVFKIVQSVLTTTKQAMGSVFSNAQLPHFYPINSTLIIHVSILQ